jgi:hypothetical protein
MVGLAVMCPVCGAREELECGSVKEVTSLLTCALPPCPRCGWAREEDRADPRWKRLAPVYDATLMGREVKESWVTELVRGPP